MKDAKSLLLVLLAAGLTATWIYHIYDKNRYAAARHPATGKDTATENQSLRDSLQRLYAATISEMKEPATDSLQSDFDSLKSQLNSRVLEINRLRNEINAILSSKNLSRTELADAKDKIMELRSKIEEMQGRNSALEEEQKKLNEELGQLNAAMKDLEDNVSKLGAENKDLKEKINNASTLTASDIRLRFIDIRSGGDTETETSKAKKANKFVISFVVQNSIAQFDNTEIAVIITDPDGQVVTNEVWESGNIETKKDGIKIYTRKLKFDYSKNEQKRLIFSLDYDNFKKGEYRLTLYHNGVRIGETSKSLG